MDAALPAWSKSKSLLVPGTNCWRIERANRVRFLIDGDAYFSAFREATANAHKSIFILGWDISSRVRLVDNATDGLPETLCEYLNALVRRRRGLNIYILPWDFAMVYAMEREWLSAFRHCWQKHRRMHFKMDGKHPVGASHHQKVVVVDDSVAFSGGLDLTARRRDSPAHKAVDPHRISPDGTPYPPFHDVQIMVDGDAAAALGELARERWRRATGRTLTIRPLRNVDPWPESMQPDMENVDVAIARTEPRYNSWPGHREVERLFLDSIAAARQSIYMECQYLTSDAIGKALAARLQEEDGPEVVVITRRESGGWLEQNTMQVLRSRLLKRLRGADRHNRFRAYYPDVPGLRANEYVTVHSKVMIVDDWFVRVGSANISNRSMGLDTECDLAIDAINQTHAKQAIEHFRNRLLAEHLDTKPAFVSENLARHGSLIQAIEHLRGVSDRTFKELNNVLPDAVERQYPDSKLLDPERPMNGEELLEHFVPPEEQGPTSHRGMRFALLLAVLIALAAAWRWTPLSEWLDVQTLTEWGRIIEQSAWAPLTILLAYVLGVLIGVPVTLLITATALIFSPVVAFVYAFVGSMASAVSSYGVGYYAGRDFIQRIAGDRVNKLSKRLARRGVLTIMALRIVPVAPYLVVNVVAGASHISFRDYLLGTIFGMTPGILLLTIFVDRLLVSVRKPELGTFIAVAVAGAVLFLGMWAFRRWARKRAMPNAQKPKGID